MSATMLDNAVILLAEDREDDIILIRRAFFRARLFNPLHIVRDGEEAINYLQGSGKYSHRDEFPLPALILLDLKMPRVDGFHVLEWIRGQPSFQSIAVLVLTSSDQTHDINRAYSLGANSFLVKPSDFENYIQLGTLIRRFWIDTTKLPETSRPPRPAKSKRLKSSH